jgi:hypothetical protein
MVPRMSFRWEATSALGRPALEKLREALAALDVWAEVVDLNEFGHLRSRTHSPPRFTLFDPTLAWAPKRDGL